MRMDKTTFENCLTAYGSKPENWPARIRVAMQDHISAHAPARAMVSREAALDEMLDADLPDAPPALIGRLISDMQTTLQNTVTAHFNWQRFGLAMAACLVAGVLSAPMIIEFIGAEPDLLAGLQLAGDDFLLN